MGSIIYYISQANSIYYLLKEVFRLLTIIYRILVGIILTMTIWNLFEEEKFLKQVNNALLIVPLLLRLLMIK